jgi:phytoene synthase
MSSDQRLFTGIFRRGSRTYFTSTRFFPEEVRRDVFRLYAFVRTADDFVDRTPQDREGFEAFREATVSSRTSKKPSGDPVIDGFLDLSRRRGFEPPWADSFLESMAMDLEKRNYVTLAETLGYVYGSAEVIGLMMSAVMGLGRDAFPHARLLGRAMQYINFIRDIQEDSRLGRTYLPASHWRGHGLAGLTEAEARRSPDAFRAFIGEEISRYRGWQREAEEGYRFLPRRCLVPIRTAADMYAWTAEKILRDPLIVFTKKVKPSKARVLWRGGRQMLSGGGG